MCFPKTAGQPGKVHGPMQHVPVMPTLARSLIEVNRPDMQSASSIVLLRGLPTPDASFMASSACTRKAKASCLKSGPPPSQPVIALIDNEGRGRCNTMKHGKQQHPS